MTTYQKGNEVREKIRKLHEKDKELNAQQIAARLGISRHHVYGIAKELGLKIPKKAVDE